MNDTEKKKYFYFLSGKRNELHLLVVHLRLSNGNRVRKTWVRRSEHKRVACSQFSSNVMWVRRDARTLLYQWANILLDRWSATTCGMCVKRTKSATQKFSYIDLSRTKWVKFHFISHICLSHSLSAFQFDIEWFFPSNISIILFVFWHQFQTVFTLYAFARIYRNSADFIFWFSSSFSFSFSTK